MGAGTLLSAGVVAVLIGISVFVIIAVIGVSAIVSKKRILKKAETGDKQRDMYEEYIGTDIKVMLKKVGIDPAEYIQECRIASIEPNFYALVICRIISIVFLFAAVALIATGNTYISLVGMLLSVVIMNAPKKKAKSIAADRKARFDAEIPRFLDMLDSGLIAGMTIQNAIEYTTRYLDGVLAEEMRMALAETELGAKDWNEALVDVAAKYANPNFSDFATDLATSYSKGVSVIEAVERKSRQIKSANLLTAKEKAAALTSKILVPTMMFKMIPLMAALLIPVFMIMEEGMF